MKTFGKSYGWVATGAEVRNYGGTLRLIWGHSNQPVDVSDGGPFRPRNGHFYWDMRDNHFLFFEIHNFDSNNRYLYNRPTEHLKPWVYTDSSYEFVCMKDGKFMYLSLTLYDKFNSMKLSITFFCFI